MHNFARREAHQLHVPSWLRRADLRVVRRRLLRQTRRGGRLLQAVRVLRKHCHRRPILLRLGHRGVHAMPQQQFRRLLRTLRTWILRRRGRAEGLPESESQNFTPWSLSIEIYIFAACSCNECGTDSCESYNGVCNCMRNVIGAECDRCAYEHWNFDSCQVLNPFALFYEFEKFRKNG